MSSHARRRRRHRDRLRAHHVPFLEPQRPVVHAGGQPEAVFGERRLAPEVAAEHAADLRHGDVAFVGKHQRVVRHVFEQRRRRLARTASGEIARIVLDAGAASGRFHHFEIEGGALLQPLRFQKAALVVELVEPQLQLGLDRLDRLHQRRARRDIVRVGVDLDEFEFVLLVAGERIEFLNVFDGVAEQIHAPGAVLIVRREDVDDVAAHAEGAAGEIGRGALVLQRHQIGDQLALVDALAFLQRKGHRGVGLDRADTVDARHRGDDDDVVALQQRARRRMAHAVDLLVDRGILLDIGVGPRHIGLGLVVVVIADEIFDGVVGEEALELAIELRRQRLVRRQDDGRALRRLDHLGHGVGLAGTGDAEQHLRAVVAADAFDQILDRGRLVALRLIFGLDDERHAAFGFFRAGRTMRRPDFDLAVLALEFGTAVADQRVQRIRRGGDAQRLHLVARRPREGGGVFLFGGEAELFCQFGIESRDRRGGAVVRWREFGLRGFVEAGIFGMEWSVEESAEAWPSSPSPLAGRGRGWGGHGHSVPVAPPTPTSPASGERRGARAACGDDARADGCGFCRSGSRIGIGPELSGNSSASICAPGARQLRRRRGDPRNYPAAVAGRCRSPCRFRHD